MIASRISPSWLDIDRGTAQSRLGNRTKIRDRLEEESDAFHERVIQAYRDLAKNEPKRVVQIDGRVSPDAIEQQVWHELVDRFPVLASYQTSKISHQPFLTMSFSADSALEYLERAHRKDRARARLSHLWPSG